MSSTVTPLIHLLAARIYRTAGRVTLMRKSARAALSQAKLPHPVELTIRLSNDAELLRLNSEFRHVDAPTDVLSFGGDEFIDGRFIGQAPDDSTGNRGGPPSGTIMLGDIVISMDRCTAQAHEFGHGSDDELALLIVHGVLHLCGFDHLDRKRKKIMWQAQDSVFAELGRVNPLKPGQFH